MRSAFSNEKILLIGNYLLDHQESMQRFANALEKSLSEKNIPCEVLRPPVILGHLSKKLPSLSKILGYFDKYFLFPLYLSYFTFINSFKGVHILDHSNSVYRPWLNGATALITCHDLLAIRGALGKFQHHRVGWSGRILQSWILKNLNAADGVAFVSNKTKDDFHQLINDLPLEERQIYMGLTYPYQKLQDTEEELALIHPELTKAPYLLHVGSNAWYKNRQGMIELFIVLKKRYRLPHRLVFAGESLTPELKKLLEKNKLLGEVLDLSKQTDLAFNHLYSNAEALLFLSLEEGFGWPVLEAMASGCLVVTTHRPPMDEIGGHAAYYLERYPEDSQAIEGWVHESASKLHSILTQPLASKERHRALGLERAKLFSNEKMIEQYCELYRDLFDIGD